MKKKLQLTILTFSAFLLFFSGGVFGQNTKVIDVRTVDHSFYIDDNASNEMDISGSYTIETWLYVSSVAAWKYLFNREGVWRMFFLASSGAGEDYRVRFDCSGTNVTITGLQYDTWHHIAVTRDGTWLRIFRDGTKLAASNAAGFELPASANALFVGSKTSTEHYSSFIMDEFRISDIARYTADFDPYPTTSSPLSSDANTVLLFDFDDSALPPSNSSSKIFSVTNNGLVIGDYAVPTDLPLPVELTSFTAVANGNNVVLEWATATEVNNYGFEVQRTLSGVEAWEVIGFVEGAGNSNSPKQYSFVDADNLSGEVSYRLKQVDADGGSEYSDVVKVNASGLAKTELFQNYPNPFNPTTQISFKLANANQVNVSVYNTLGEKVAELVNEVREAGVHNLKFDASNLSSGFYIYRIETPNYSKTMKMLLIK